MTSTWSGRPTTCGSCTTGDNSRFPVGATAAEGPEGSDEIEQLFHDYFGSQELPSEETPFSGRSDYGPFIAEGVPAGGLFTGAEVPKTAAQVPLYGGTAGVPYDPCYHLVCDTYEGTGSGAGATPPGLGTKALDEMSDAAAHAVLFMSKSKVDLSATAPAALRTSGAPAQPDFPSEDHVSH